MRSPSFDRVVLIILDGVGIGEMPDAARFGDDGSDTLGHLCRYRQLTMPNLLTLGLGNIKTLDHVSYVAQADGSFGKAGFVSDGKDTVAGHWELAGVPVERAFPTYPSGFPAELIASFEAAIQRKVLGNVVASGTEIINRFGAEHIRTGRPIVYTSADSVFQIAAHEDVIPVGQLYEFCQVARNLLVGEHRVGRVIARPFIGSKGVYARTSRRHDFPVEPPSLTLLDRMMSLDLETITIGKVASIFCGRGVTRDLKAGSNSEVLDTLLRVLADDFRGLVFANLNDFDTLYGHRNDKEGFARALEDFDKRIPDFRGMLKLRDLCMITGDHGNDPSTPSTDHSREYVPLIAFGPKVRKGQNLGIRETLGDLGQTIAENFGFHLDHGRSFLSDLMATAG